MDAAAVFENQLFRLLAFSAYVYCIHVGCSRYNPVVNFTFSLKAVRTKVWVQKLKSALFNTETYAHGLEGLFERMWKKEENGQKPDHLSEPW